MATKAEAREAAYIEGCNSVYREMLSTALRMLGKDSPEWNAQRWQIERAATVAVLRQVCERHGDNDWSDDLYLPDVIEKHLDRHLD